MRVVKKRSLMKSLSMAVVPIVAAFALVLSTGVSYAVAPTVVYNNIPNPIPANVASLGFEATQTSEFGGQIGLGGNEQYNPNVTVLMSSWACENGQWTAGCVTTPGTTFTHPVTLNVYAVGDNNTVGSKIATSTKTFTMPFRPSSNCATDAQKWTAPDGSCKYGLAFPISFSFEGKTFPNKVILGVAYNTATYGENPLGVTGPYDSLNVGTATTPTVGTALPTANDAYIDSMFGGPNGAYCDEGVGGLGAFRLDEGCWGGFLPAFKVTASAVTPTNKDQCKKDGWKSFGSMFKNQGDCVSSTNRQ